MLQTLRIRNLALLEAVSLDFEAGFTAVTGETGAGKSILLGALSLLAGGRADKMIIRQGAESCEVEAALFFADAAKIDSILHSLDLPPSEDGVVILKRAVSREKPPRISVNGSLATLGALQQLGERWIDFHGPSEPRRLLKLGCQLQLLDLFARAGEALAKYSAAFDSWRDLAGTRRRIAEGSRLSPEQIDFLRKQIAQIDELGVAGGAAETLERDFQRMSRAHELADLASTLADGIAAEGGAQARIGELLREARRLEQIDPSSKPLAERLSSIALELNDLAGEFSALTDQLQFDPEQAEVLSARMNAWLELKRRHGPDIDGVVASRERMSRQIEEQADIEGTLSRLDQRIAASEAAARMEARTLRELRENAGRELEKVAGKSIAQLGFQRADFKVRIVPLPELGPSGDCECEFLFSPNAGEPMLPLHRIASSGELARVMLALKTVLADIDEVPLLVFDEVDANVGGEIGRTVGAKMAEISAGHQVLCVTHLPQVAAQAACHLVVSKDQVDNRTAVTIEPIQASRKARVSELARMLGDRSAKSAIAHAEQLLESRRR